MMKLKLNTNHIDSLIDYTLKSSSVVFGERKRQRKRHRQEEKQRLIGRYRKKGIEIIRDTEAE